MRDIPIIFSGPMVRALLHEVEKPGIGKTMTRRLAWREAKTLPKSHDIHVIWRRPYPRAKFWQVSTPWQRVKTGDRLWVRENFYVEGGPRGDDFGYAADIPLDQGPPRLVPCIHMPRHLSRLTLVVTATKIERLTDISERDCFAEGVVGELLDEDTGRVTPFGPVALMNFGALWEKLHGPGSWLENPEVVALTFTVHKCNIGDMPQAVAA